MNSIGIDVKAEISRLFFIEQKSIKQIVSTTKLHAQTIRKYLKKDRRYAKEKDRRKHENAVKQKQAKKAWDRKNRSTGSLGSHDIEKAILRNDHKNAVDILSREKYFN